MNDFTLLTEEDLKNGSTKIFDIFGTISAISDFAILLGGEVSNSNFIHDESDLKYRTGLWWTKSVNEALERCAVYADGFIKWNPPFQRTIGARPCTKYSDKNEEVNEDGVIFYGEYPQSIVPVINATSLEELYCDNKLNKTGKVYTMDDSDILTDYTPFNSREFIEYKYMGEKYIRIVGDSKCKDIILSDGRKIEEGTAYWIKVEPIEWIVDKGNDLIISKQILFAGISFDNSFDEFSSDFDNTNMKWYLDTHFSKDIIPSIVRINTNVENVKKVNPYDFDYEIVSEEDIIRGMVESNIAVFLHGKSSDGKSARVKELDPDCEIIYLANATPDSLNGKTAFNSNTNEMIDIPPTWYIKLNERCESEPDKLHILFLDEITNAVPSIQSMAFNIVLNKEVNGKWKLPENARIVAAGNEYEESMAANEMVEPLFNRFAHVYINTTVESWLKWASTPVETYERLSYKEDSVPMKIHPSIYAYIAYKSSKGEDVLRTPYDGKMPNADPRKWEMASKVLYKTNNPEMLKALIGKDMTEDFIDFTKRCVITEEVVMNDSYINIQMDSKDKFNTAVVLSKTTTQNVEKVRNFVKSLGSDVCDVFDTLWIDTSEKKKIIEELKNKELEIIGFNSEKAKIKTKVM